MMDDDPIADGERGHAGPGLGDDSRRFVAEDDRRLRRDVPGRRIAAADTDRLHRDDDLAGAGDRRLHVHQRHVVERAHEDGLHGTRATFIAAAAPGEVERFAPRGERATRRDDLRGRDRAARKEREGLIHIARRVVERAHDRHLAIVDRVRVEGDARPGRQPGEEEHRPPVRGEPRQRLDHPGIAGRVDDEGRKTGATSPRCAQPLPYSFQRKRISPVAFLRRRSGAPRRQSPLSPSKEKTALPQSGPCPRSGRPRRQPPPSLGSSACTTLANGSRSAAASSERPGRNPSEPVLHDALRDEEKVREGPEERPLERRRAEVLSASTAVVAAPAGAGHRRGHTLPGREGRSRARRLDDTRELVAERERERNLRMAAPQELEIGRARERDGHAHEHLARPRFRGRDLTERDPLRPIADECPHLPSLAGR